MSRADHPLTTRDRASTRTRPLTAAVAMAVALTACGGNGDDSATEDRSFAPASDAAEGSDAGAAEGVADDSSMIAAESTEEAGDSADTEADAATEGPSTAEDSAGTNGSPGGTQQAGLTAAELNRSIIYTATIEVDVDDVTSAGVAAVDAVERAGGFVFGQDSIGGAEPRSVFVFKVRPADFDTALAALDGIGELRNQVISADDVTERVVDLESRIQVAELGVARLRAALEETTDLTEFAEVERLLLERETELEVMRGQIRTLQDQVDLATITLILTQDRVENNLQLTVTSYEEHNGGLSCPGQADNRIEAGTDLTMCFELLNAGDQALTDLTLVDTVLGIDDTTALVTVYGSLDDTLQPGQSIIVAFETTAERTVQTRTVAGGQPVAVEGEEPAGPPVSTIRNSTIRVTPSDDAPGFGDGFDQGKIVISGIWSAVLVTIGFVLPLLVLVPFLVGAGWLLRSWRRRRPTPPAPAPAPPAPTPPPPAAPAEPQAS